MKYIFLFFSLLFSVKGAFAECGFSDISVFPAADTIKFSKPTVESPPNWRREGDMLVEIEED